MSENGGCTTQERQFNDEHDDQPMDVGYGYTVYNIFGQPVLPSCHNGFLSFSPAILAGFSVVSEHAFSWGGDRLRVECRI